MDVTRLLWLSGFIAGTTYITSTYSTSFALQRPVQTAVLTLLTTGLLLLFSFKFSADRRARNNDDYNLTSHLGTAGTFVPRRQNASFTSQIRRILNTRKMRALAALIVIIVCGRVEILRQIINNSQCSRQSLAYLIPLGVAVYDQSAGPTRPDHAEGRKFSQSWTTRLAALTSSPIVLAAGLLSMASLLAGFAIAMPRSTYICAPVRRMDWVIPALQALGTILDCSILVLLDILIARTPDDSAVTKTKSLVGWLCIFSSVLLFIPGLNPWMTSQYRWYLEDITAVHLRQNVSLAVPSAFTVLCGISLFCWEGLSSTVNLWTFVCVYISSIMATSEYRRISSPFSPYIVIFYLFLAGAGLILNFRAYNNKAVESMQFLKSLTSSSFSRTSFLILVVLNLIPLLMWSSRTPQNTLGHPIETLILRADTERAAWARQASTSSSLHEAAQNYRLRYKRDPPPNFHHWYNFATLHNSQIIDDFDNIHNDILPFWSLPPVKIRQRTLEAIANPWNNIAGIMIRGGQVSVSAGTPISHDWMMNGTADMIRPFAQWLPDMDLAFNLNDEGRVVVPYDSFLPMLQTALKAFQSSANQANSQQFSPFHLRNWPPIPSEPISTTRFTERSWHPTWSEYGSISCPPTSPSRTHHVWDYSSSSPSYFSPHMYHGYISNYTHSFSPCHQPDLAHLHGLHISPAAFKGTHDLMPVFSQSKAGGYNDIRYPSAWNYVDRERTVYAPNTSYPDPEFADKERTLFWRGGTTEGVSAFEAGNWMGMARQRMVWLFENGGDSDGVRHNVHLPTSSTSQNAASIYTPATFPPSSLRANLPINISLHIPSSISRCADSSCNTQHNLFHCSTHAPIDFQSHWSYKYLLDMDGAGFSGRFLPFLHSRSLVFKMGVVREWWEGRVRAWWDFVPLDVRGHEMVGAVSFFGGWKGKQGKGLREGEWTMQPRDDVAERIALQGKRTAESMLRKVDMEIYMFRLLLEWGRVVDDAREDVGFRGDL